MNLEDAISAKPYTPSDYDPSLNGFGGFFIFVIIGRFLTAITSVVLLMHYTSSNRYAQILGAYYNIIIACLIGLSIVMSVVVLFFIFKRNIIFRTLLVIQIAVTSIIDLIGIIVLSHYCNSMGEDAIFYRPVIRSGVTRFLISVIISVLWIGYLYMSSRVKNTFIYCHKYESPGNNGWLTSTPK